MQRRCMRARMVRCMLYMCTVLARPCGASGTLGAELQTAAANETASLCPPHQFVPWVVVQGVPLGDTFEQLLRFVCVALDGNPKCVVW